MDFALLTRLLLQPSSRRTTNVGSAILNELVSRSHHATAVARNLDKVVKSQLEKEQHHYERFTLGY